MKYLTSKMCIRDSYYPAEGEAIDIASLTYTNNVLTSVTDRAGRNIAITVADDTRLTRITDYDGYYSAYTYCCLLYTSSWR